MPVIGATLAAANVPHTVRAAHAANADQHAAINCEYSAMCAEVANSSEIPTKRCNHFGRD